MNDQLLKQVAEAFTTFSPGPAHQVRVFFAPGRVNLIGEHLDYNGGYVFPAALTQGIWLFIRPRTDRIVRFHSLNFDHEVTAHMEHLQYQEDDRYANYPKGVLWVMRQAGATFEGADFLFASNLPSQAGLSSSAALEVVTAFAVNRLSHCEMSIKQLVLLAQQAENQFVGVKCGIMDQFAVGFGKAHHALLLQTADLSYEQIPFKTDHVQLVIANTNFRRELSDSKYNERRSQCEEVLVAVHSIYPDVLHLANVTESMWEEVASHMKDDTLVKRGRHVVTESARVIAAANALRQHDIERFGTLMNESHQSLRDDYEVTGKYLDALASAANEAPGCIGSRMTGAGFGGCTVSLVQTQELASFERFVTQVYQRKVGYQPSFYVSDVGDGVHEVTEEVMDRWPF
ncbi:MAG: galactokinase [Acidibacillus sp.]|uniref:Galactokinase n=1 Tax=Sulfoacidibacillus ferrooxidans TaxID=2005001 RepID=A0A9X2AD86_9BACL|nr:galactokinase [Sulfoacidibacillus ferrooxidans]MCI0182067.1 Galactokinase [Sulfoacidibacillus ferrooxidans]MCY0892442.1 galactokinase [Acidibacillus sp.]